MQYIRLTPGEFRKNIPEIIGLHDECFGPGATKEYFAWRYLQAPNQDLFVNVAVENQQLAAFYAVVPIKLQHNGNLCDAALSLNTMTSAKHQGKGLFVELAKRTYAQLLEENYQCVMGFPNSISNRTFNSQLSVPTVAEVPMLELDISAEKISEINIKYDNQYLLDYTKVKVPENRISVVKSADYLRWRYSDSPEHTYENVVLAEGNVVKAYATCKIWKDRLNLVEFHANNADFADELLMACKYHAMSKMCSYVTVWEPINTPLHHLLEKRKFINRYPIHYFIATALSSANCGVDVTDPRNWALQMGDNNTY